MSTGLEQMSVFVSVWQQLLILTCTNSGLMEDLAHRELGTVSTSGSRSVAFGNR